MAQDIAGDRNVQVDKGIFMYVMTSEHTKQPTEEFLPNTIILEVARKRSYFLSNV